MSTDVQTPTTIPLSSALGREPGRLWPAVRALGWPGGVVLAFVFVAVFGSLIAPNDPLALHATSINVSPFKDGAFPLGTDQLGRDVLSRTLVGGRLSLLIGIGPVIVAGLVGFALGALAAFGPRWLSFALLRMLDVALAFPAIMLALAVAAMLGPSVRNTLIAMVIVLIPPITRVSRAAALDVAGRPYMAAARMSGASRVRIVRDFAVPNMVAPVLTYVASLCGLMIIFGAGLSFIGVGVQPPTAEWGRMIADGRAQFFINPGMSLVPGACIFIVSLAFNLVADRLRDHFDPWAS
jgi:ABC-type dipeptide/oligopeptide/nickel transport system permease subunit